MEKLKKWFENFWYHYKWHSLIVLFLVFTLVVGIGQITFEKKNYDVYLLYVGADYMQKEAHDEIVELFEATANEVAAADGKKDKMDVNLQMLVYLSEEEIAKRTAEAEANGETYIYHPSQNNEILETFKNLISAGENVIMFLDPSLYGTARVNGALYPVEDVIGKGAAGVDSHGTGIVLSESGLLERYPCLKALPENSVLCFKRITHSQSMIGKKESDYTHTFQKAVAKEMFGVKE